MNGANILSQKLGLDLNIVFGINSPVINTIMVEIKVCNSIITNELLMNKANGALSTFAISIPYITNTTLFPTRIVEI